ncbi:MAG: RHS repeat-associated core domain-containing protein [bacterium]
MNYTYNLAGGVVTHTNSQGVTFTQQFSGAGQVTQLTSSWNDAQHPGTLASGLLYHPHGAMQKGLLGNGLTETAAFNNRLQPCRINVNSSGTLVNLCADPVPTGNVLDFNYGFAHAAADNGNIMTWAAVGQQNFNRSFTYDQLNRIQSLAGTGGSCTGLSWSYDIWGNRTAQTVTSGTCTMSSLSFNGNNRITNTGFVYDAAGNLTNEPGKTYQYDAENRMTSVGGGSTATYVYNAEGQRVRKTAGGVTTDYIRDLGGQVVAERVGSTWTIGYVYMNGQLVAQYSNGTTYFAHKDHLGSTRLLTKVDQSIQECTDYLPFGEQRTDTCLTPGAATTSHKFTGHERDAESGLDYMGARYYAGPYGRFVQVDPKLMDQRRLRDPQLINMYAYSRNNPLRYIDPDGADVKTTVTITVQTFSVQGKNFAEASQNAKKLETDNGTSQARTTVSTSVKTRENTTYQPSNGGVQATTTVVDVEVTVDITVELPDWEGYDQASPEDQQAWGNLESDLANDEFGHVASAVQAAPELGKAIEGTTGTGKGKTPDEAQKNAQKNSDANKDKKSNQWRDEQKKKAEEQHEQDRQKHSPKRE